MPANEPTSNERSSSSAPVRSSSGRRANSTIRARRPARRLREEGYEVVLVNSNPATIMTDPELAQPHLHRAADRRNSSRRSSSGRRPDALLPTVGGQTALNIAVELAESGVLEKYDVEMIGAKAQAVKMAEDRLLFKQAMREIGLATPKSEVVGEHAAGAAGRSRSIGFPAVIRPSFTLGGTGGGIAYNSEEFEEIVQRGLDLSPVHEVLIEESVIGWKEFELEVMRDLQDNVVIICSIENFDPMGVHTGDSITVAPAQTLTDREYQRHARRCRRRHPADRRRDRRLQHSVCRQSERRPSLSSSR